MSETRFSLARVVLLTVGTLIPLPRLAAQSEGSSPMGARIDEYLQRAGAFGFAGVVLVSVDGKVVLQKGYGRIGVSGAAPLNAATVLPIASLTKQFTATAILRLEMQGRLSTSDSISDHFADVPEDKKTITIHQLLTHTSGIVSELPDAVALRANS